MALQNSSAQEAVSSAGTSKFKRTSENAQVAMALLARTFRRVVGLPWSTLEFLDWAMQWRAMPVILEGPTSEIWAEDLFTPCSTKCWISPSIDDFTDCSGSEICDDELDDDDEWSCSDSEEEIDGFNFVNDGDVDFWGDRWLWHEDDVFVVQSCSDFGDLGDVETTNYVMEKLVDYVMPSMNFNAEVDDWIDKYGSSRSQFRFVTFSPREPSTIDSSSAFVLPSTSTGLFVTVL